MEIKIYAGKCKCKRDLDMKITDAREKEEDPKSRVVAWIIFGVCKKCNTIYFQGLFTQEEKPIVGRDFIIDYEKEVKKQSHENNKKK